MMNGKYDESRDAAVGPFDEALDRFLTTGRVSDRAGEASVMARRVRDRKVRDDRVVRSALCSFGVIVLSLSLWLGYGMDRGGISVAEPLPEDSYAEIHVLEDLFFGAEALADEDMLDTLEFLMGG